MVSRRFATLRLQLRCDTILRYDYDPTTTYRARLLPFDVIRRRREKWAWSLDVSKCKQEAQLPLRNRASAMHFFVSKLLYITVMTYNCV